MNTSIYIAGSGLRAYQQKLDTIANNVANVNTAGYKAREASFSENLATAINNQANVAEEKGRLTPYGIRTGSGVHLVSTYLNVEQGSLQKTDDPNNIAIAGKGFFQLGRQNGNGLDIVYSRNGAFQKALIEGNRYRLVNASGDVLLDRSGNPIELDNALPFSIQGDGTIAGSNQRIAIVDVQNPQQLRNLGENIYELENGAVSFIDSQVQQGYLEMSNVDLSKEMIEMISAQRGFQFNTRALSYADQMMGIANNIVK